MQAALIPYYPLGSMYIVHGGKKKVLTELESNLCASVDIMTPKM